MAARSPRDVRTGGRVGVLLAGWFCVVAAIVTVAGALGTSRSVPAEAISPPEALIMPGSLHWAVVHGIGGVTGGVLLLLLGLASLAPACYAVPAYAERLQAHWPAPRLAWWIWLGSLPSFVLVATSWAGRLEVVFGLMGAFIAPIVGVISAEALRERFRWKGVRQGWHLPGVLAWALGATAGVLLRGRIEPASLFAYGIAAASYTLLVRTLPESPTATLLTGEPDRREEQPAA
jgi:hypothetical protein